MIAAVASHIKAVIASGRDYLRIVFPHRDRQNRLVSQAFWLRPGIARICGAIKPIVSRSKVVCRWRTGGRRQHVDLARGPKPERLPTLARILRAIERTATRGRKQHVLIGWIDYDCFSGTTKWSNRNPRGCQYLTDK